MICLDPLGSVSMAALATCTSAECQTDTSGGDSVDGDDRESDEK